MHQKPQKPPSPPELGFSVKNILKNYKLPRFKFKLEQLMVLEETFRTKKYPTSAEKLATAEVTGLSKYQVHVWLQNRRMKWKNSMGMSSEELKSVRMAEKTCSGFPIFADSLYQVERPTAVSVGRPLKVILEKREVPRSTTETVVPAASEPAASLTVKLARTETVISSCEPARPRSYP